MNIPNLQRSHRIISEQLNEEQLKNGLEAFDSLWTDADDDKTVIKKYRAHRANFLQKIRFELRVMEAATYARVKDK